MTILDKVCFESNQRLTDKKHFSVSFKVFMSKLRGRTWEQEQKDYYLFNVVNTPHDKKYSES